MNQLNKGQDPVRRPMQVGKGDSSQTRTTDDPLGIDDIGLPADMHPDQARAPERVRPDPAMTGGVDNESVTQGTVPLEENQRHPSDPLKPGEDDEYGTRLEKLASKIVPPSHEVKDEDIMDPGRQTPGAPPVDNRS